MYRNRKKKNKGTVTKTENVIATATIEGQEAIGENQEKAPENPVSEEEIDKSGATDEGDREYSDINALRDIEKKVLIPFERKTRIQKSSVDRTIKSLYKDWKKGLLRFDLAIQRNDVWSNEQRSMLIHSLLYGFPIPPVYVHESDDEMIWFLDGKQRVGGTLMPFINGDFALSKNTPDIFGHKIAGCKFKDLPEDIQDTILDETIQLIKMKNMTDEETDEMFIRLNSGSTLTRMELTRAMHSELIEKINEISGFDFFAKDIALTGKARNRFVDQEIILQIAMLMEEGIKKFKGFGSSHIKDFVLRLKKSEQTLSDELVMKFKEVCDYLSKAVDDFDNAERKKALKKIHVPIIFDIAQKAMEKKIQPELFGSFIRSFLITNYSVESDYGVSCQAGSSKKDNVVIRLHEMNMAFNKFADKLKVANNLIKAVDEFDKELSEEVNGQVKAQQRKSETRQPY